MLSPWFVAAYYGACAGCGTDIQPNDLLQADNTGGSLCESCASEGDHDD